MISKWPELPSDLKDYAIFPNNHDYDSVRSNYFRSALPNLVIMANSVSVAVKTVNYINQVRQTLNRKVPFSIRSGGHGMTLASVNDNGLILDISQLNKVEIVNADKRLIKIQPGAVWGDVAQKLSPSNLVISSGDFGDTGVGGLTVYGGIGLLVRRFGLTIDHVVAAKIITASGEILTVDSLHHPDLFWAVRGGGSQCGIVIEFMFKADKLVDPLHSLHTPINLQDISYVVTDLEQFISRWQRWTCDSETKLTSLLMVTNGKDNNFNIAATNIWSGSDNNANQCFKQALTLASISEVHQKQLDYADLVVAPHTPHSGQQKVYVKNTLIADFNPQITGEIKNLLNTVKPIGVELRYIGGALNHIKSSETAWTNREAKGLVALWVQNDQASQANQEFKELLKLGVGVYGGYSSDLSTEENKRVWPDINTYNRIKKITKQIDPNSLFNQDRHI